MKIHILESNNGYKVVIRFATLAGNNEIGLSWKSVGLASGMIGSTTLEVGTDPSNITQAEHDSIIAGDIIEIVKTIVTGEATNDAVEELADVAISEAQTGMASKLRYFGHTIN